MSVPMFGIAHGRSLDHDARAAFGGEKSPPNSRDRQRGICALALLFFWLALSAYVVHGALPANALHLPFEDEFRLQHFLPQGWAFFTRNPRYPTLSAYTRGADGAWHPVPRQKRMWPHFLNFSRRWKLTGVEIGLTLYELPAIEWQPCQHNPFHCLDQAPESGPITNVRQSPVLCGEVGLVKQEPLPWAWSQAPDETEMPSEVIRAHVACHD
jgi:antimicrobial peptide system SdpA family protein